MALHPEGTGAWVMAVEVPVWKLNCKPCFSLLEARKWGVV